MSNLLKNYLFNSGLTKQNYNLISPRIKKDNQEKLKTFSIFSTAFFIIAFVLFFIFKWANINKYIYLSGILISVVTFYIAKKSNKNSNLITSDIYLFMTMLLIISIIFYIIDEKNTFFITMLLTLPLLFNERPIRMMIFIILFSIIFIVISYYKLSIPLLEKDIINVVSFSIISIFTSTYLSTIKCRNHLNQYQFDKISKVDALTGLNNRHVINEFANKYQNKELPKDFTIIYFDVNGLKNINDNLGHEKGDELIKGAAYCISQTFNKYGTCCRVGGDEFVVLININKNKLQTVCNEFEEKVNNWSSENINKLSISYGIATTNEFPNLNFSELSKIADTRLYKNKDLFYQNSGLDRRKKQQTHEDIYKTYKTILFVNLKEETYKIINQDLKNQTFPNYTDYLKDFLTNENIENNQEFITKTSINYLKNYFDQNNKSIIFYYQTNKKDKYLVEIIKSSNYAKIEPLIYILIKQIDKNI